MEATFNASDWTQINLRTPRYWFNLLIAQKQTVLFSLKSVESILVWSAQWYWLPIEGMAWSGSIHIDRDSEQCTYCTTHMTQLCTYILLNLFCSLYFTVLHCTSLYLIVPYWTVMVSPYLSVHYCISVDRNVPFTSSLHYDGPINVKEDGSVAASVTLPCNWMSRWGGEHWAVSRTVQ